MHTTLYRNPLIDQPGPRAEPTIEVDFTAEPATTEPDAFPAMHAGDPCSQLLLTGMTFDGKATTGAWFRRKGFKSVFFKTADFKCRPGVAFVRKGEAVNVTVSRKVYDANRVELSKKDGAK